MFWRKPSSHFREVWAQSFEITHSSICTRGLVSKLFPGLTKKQKIRRADPQQWIPKAWEWKWRRFWRSQRKACQFILFWKLVWRRNKSPTCRKHLKSLHLWNIQGGVKTLDLSFPITLWEMNANLKKSCSITQQPSEAAGRAVSLRRAHGVLCGKDHTEQTVYKDAQLQRGSLAIPQHLLGQPGWGSTPAVHHPCRLTEVFLLLHLEFHRTKALPFLCLGNPKQLLKKWDRTTRQSGGKGREEVLSELDPEG